MASIPRIRHAIVKRSAARAVFTTQPLHRPTRFGLFEFRHNLADGERACLICLNFLVETLLQLTVVWGGLPPSKVAPKFKVVMELRHLTRSMRIFGFH